MRLRKLVKFVPVLAVLVALSCLGGICSDEERHNVVLFIIDTLPAEHSSAYGYERSTTPNLKRFSEDGILFKHAVAPSPWTLPSIASIFTGNYPSRHLAGWHLEPYTKEDRQLAVMRQEMVTLAEMFQNHGYQTVGFFNNPFTHPGYGLKKGFDMYDHVGGDNLNIRGAKQTTDDAIRWIDLHGEKPFFMVVHYFDPHLAYNPPIDFALPYIAFYEGELKNPFNPELSEVRSGELKLSEEDKEFIVGLYDGEVAAVDSQMGRLMGYLRAKKLYDNSLIIVTADHGEEFWQHGGFEHGHSLHREVVEVPLVMKYPGVDYAGKEVSEYISLVDIFPTVAEFMKWPLPFSIDGVSLYPRAGRLTVLPHSLVSENIHYGPQKQAFYADGFKLIVTRLTGETRVYDLSKDPYEKNDVFGKVEVPESVKFQIEHIAKNLQEHLEKGTPEAAMIDEETLEKLKSLGYLE